jgi:hypothetical protein
MLKILYLVKAVSAQLDQSSGLQNLHLSLYISESYSI